MTKIDALSANIKFDMVVNATSKQNKLSSEIVIPITMKLEFQINGNNGIACIDLQHVSLQHYKNAYVCVYIQFKGSERNGGYDSGNLASFIKYHIQQGDIYNYIFKICDIRDKDYTICVIRPEVRDGCFTGNNVYEKSYVIRNIYFNYLI